MDSSSPHKRSPRAVMLSLLIACGLPAPAAMAQTSDTPPQVQRPPSVNVPRTNTRSGRGSPLDRLSDRPVPTGGTPARTLPAASPGFPVMQNGSPRSGLGSIEHFPVPMRTIIQDKRDYVNGWNDAYRFRRDQENPIYARLVPPPDGIRISTNFLGHQSMNGALVARQSLKDSWTLPEARPPVRQPTVNDYIFRHEYILYRYGVNIANPFSRRATCIDPIRGFDSVMLEPVDISSLYPNLSAAQSQQITPTPASAPSTAKEVADQHFKSGQLALATDGYKQHLDTYPEESGVKIRLALALLDGGEIADGVALLHMVYATDPQFAATSFRDVAPAWPPGRIRTAVRRSVDHANRMGTSSAWMTVAMLMEAERRPALASQMIERASANGLDPTIYAQIRGMIETTHTPGP